VTGFEAGWIALMVAVYARTHSTVWMSAALFVVIAMSGVAAPVAGALGDRYDRRRVMVVSELVAAVFAAAMVAASTPAALIALAAMVGLAEAPFMPASSAAVPNLVPETRLEWANSTLAIGRNTGQLLGPLAGGVLVAATGARTVFALTAVAFVVCAVLVASVSGRFGDVRTPAEREESRDLRAGFVAVWRSPVLRGIAAAWMVFLFMLGPILVAELPLAHEFGQGAAGYGAIAACWGGGSIIGSFLGRRTARISEGGSMVWGCVLTGTGFATVALAPVFGFALLGMIVAGLADGTVTVSEMTIIQRSTTDNLRSRVNAAIDTITAAAFALSFPAAGFLINLLGVRGAYWMAAIGCWLAALILVPAMRALRRQPAQAEAQAPVRAETLAR
jgi:MFS family permease